MAREFHRPVSYTSTTPACPEAHPVKTAITRAPPARKSQTGRGNPPKAVLASACSSTNPSAESTGATVGMGGYVPSSAGAGDGWGVNPGGRVVFGESHSTEIPSTCTRQSLLMHSSGSPSDSSRAVYWNLIRAEAGWTWGEGGGYFSSVGTADANGNTILHTKYKHTMNFNKMLDMFRPSSVVLIVFVSNTKSTSTILWW